MEKYDIYYETDGVFDLNKSDAILILPSSLKNMNNFLFSLFLKSMNILI